MKDLELGFDLAIRHFSFTVLAAIVASILNVLFEPQFVGLFLLVFCLICNLTIFARCRRETYTVRREVALMSSLAINAAFCVIALIIVHQSYLYFVTHVPEYLGEFVTAAINEFLPTLLSPYMFAGVMLEISVYILLVALGIKSEN